MNMMNEDIMHIVRDNIKNDVGHWIKTKNMRILEAIDGTKFAKCPLSQSQYLDFFDLVALQNEWKVTKSWFASDREKQRYVLYGGCKSPEFMNVASYLSWVDLKQDKARFEREWREHDRKHGDFWADSRMFDYRAYILYGEGAQIKYDVDSDDQYLYTLNRNEIAIVQLEGCDLDRNGAYSNLYNFDAPGKVFILSPVNESGDKAYMKILNMMAPASTTDITNNIINKWMMKVADDTTAEVRKFMSNQFKLV